MQSRSTYRIVQPTLVSFTEDQVQFADPHLPQHPLLVADAERLTLWSRDMVINMYMYMRCPFLVELFLNKFN